MLSCENFKTQPRKQTWTSVDSQKKHRTKFLGICLICNEKESKYTCPRCATIKYCSVVCFKIHKEKCTEKQGQVHPPSVNSQLTENTQEVVPGIDEHGNFRVPFELLQKLGESKELVSLLGDTRLQALIREIDLAGPTAPHVLDQNLREDPHFGDVVNLIHCIAVVGLPGL